MVRLPQARNEASLTTDQSRALAEINQLSSEETIGYAGHALRDTDLLVAIDMATAPFPRAAGGLPVHASERLYLEIPSAYPHVPPDVHVDHDRWEDHPHVLQGRRLCIYLDPAAEWNPLEGMHGFFRRLWDWFADAIANRFDPATALYHPVGGVFHRTPGAPTVVVTEPLGDHAAGFAVGKILLRQRTSSRLDLLSWHLTPSELPDGAFRGVLVTLSDSMPKGGGHRLSDLAVTIRGQDSRSNRKRFLNTIVKTARTLRPEQHLHVIIAVPNRHLTGEARFHLIGWRLPHPQVEAAIDRTRNRHSSNTPPDDDEPIVEWTYIDDGRAGMTTRRDHGRPVSWFAGKRVELWGCGALGSWIAEYLVRAGVNAITLRDTAHVTRGLLIRQNYTEHDVGSRKVEALARRLRKISDDVTADPVQGLAQAGLYQQAALVDAIVDCTVNTAVAVALERHQTQGRLPTPVVQVATDDETATLGLLTVTTGQPDITTNLIDRTVRESAYADPALRHYQPFWEQGHHPPVTPTLGCSVPTFGGSVADASAVAAAAVTLASIALNRHVATGYLFAAAHAPYDVPACVPVPVGHEP